MSCCHKDFGAGPDFFDFSSSSSLSLLLTYPTLLSRRSRASPSRTPSSLYPVNLINDHSQWLAVSFALFPAHTHTRRRATHEPPSQASPTAEVERSCPGLRMPIETAREAIVPVRLEACFSAQCLKLATPSWCCCDPRGAHQAALSPASFSQVRAANALDSSTNDQDTASLTPLNRFGTLSSQSLSIVSRPDSPLQASAGGHRSGLQPKVKPLG